MSILVKPIPFIDLFVILFLLSFTDKVKSLFFPGSRMEKALQRLANSNMTSKSTSPPFTQDSTTQTTEDNMRKVNIAIVDTPPTTPSVHQDTYLTKAFKGIPKALLEKASRSPECIPREVTSNVYHNAHLLYLFMTRNISGSRETGS